MTSSPAAIESLILRQAGALADLAFGLAGDAANRPSLRANQNLAFLNVDDLELDLTDPEQREFGDYELLGKLGQGGMGVVFKAKQRSLNREVALKLLAAGPWSSDDFIIRFKREAQSAARLQHPNIVTVFDIGEQDDLNFFTMRLVNGPTLGEYLQAQGGQLTPEHAAELGRTIAKAVDFAHRLGVLHLDIKPSNVLIDETGEPLVADFGLARQLGVSMEVDNEEISGTPSYMAPEQARLDEARLSPATDVYGLGALLYECLTGQPPFAGNTARATLDQVRSQQLRSPRVLDRQIPKDLDAICCKCLEKEPLQRYLSARTLADDLTRYLEKRPVAARPLTWLQRIAHWVRREPRVAIATATAFAILLAGLATTSLQWLRAEDNSATIQSLLWESRRETSVDLALSGRGFESTALILRNLIEQKDATDEVNADDQRRIGMLLQAAPTLLIRKQLPAGIVSTALSPDGEILVTAHADLTLRWFSTDNLQPLGELNLAGHPGVFTGRKPTMSRFVSSRRIAVTQESLDWLIKPSGATTLVDLAASQVIAPPAQFDNLIDISYSGDGTRAMLRQGTGHTAVDDRMQLWQVDPWVPLTVAAPGPIERHIFWLPLGGALSAAVYPTMQPVTLWDRLEERVLSVGQPQVYALSAWMASNDGRFLALGDVKGRVILVDTESRESFVLPAAAGDSINWVAFSEDDVWLAAASQDGTVLVFDVASRSAIGNALHHGFPVNQVNIHHGRRTLLVAGNRRSAIWRIPESSRYPRSAVRLPTNPVELGAQNQAYAITWAPRVGLYAAAETAGLVSLWRLPRSPVLRARSARQFGSRLAFDGQRVVDVRGNKLRLIASLDSLPLTDWLELPQVPGFAELSRNTLVVTCGARLLLFQLPSPIRSQFPAPLFELSLRASPQRLAISPDRARLLVSFGSAANGYFEEHLELYDLKTGRMMATETLPGPLRDMRFSRDGERLLIQGTNPDRLDLFSADSLDHQIRLFADDGYGISSAVDSSGGLLFTQFSWESGIDELMRWQVGAEEAEQIAIIGPNDSNAVGELGGKPFVLGADDDFLFGRGDTVRRLSRSLQSRTVAAHRLSLNGDFLARASRNEVQIYNREGDPLGAPLTAEISGHDAIAQLAFAPDGATLLARTARGLWLSWALGADARAPQQMQTELATLLDPSAITARDRAIDPGPWHDAAPVVVAAPARMIDGAAIPSRDPRASPLLLDLTDHYTMAPNSLAHEIGDTIADMIGFPIGVQHIDGVSYDIRGALFGGRKGGSRTSELLNDRYVLNPTLRLAPTRMSGLHILMYARLYRSSATPQRYFDLEFHYTDGTSEITSVLTQRDVPGWTDNDNPAPIGWLLSTVGTYFWDGYQIPISNPKIENPHPDRPVNAITLDWGQGVGVPPVIFGITVEPISEKIDVDL